MTQVLCINRKIQDREPDPPTSAFVDRIAQCCGGRLVSAEEAAQSPVSTPWCIRGIKFTPWIRQAMDEGRTFYYIDNAYFGNHDRKNYFRMIKNHVHDTRPVISRPRDRLDQLNITIKPFQPGRKILLAPPSAKSFVLWNIDQDQWIQETIAEIQKHTDRPIEVRVKRKREDRMKSNTMEEALEDAHCLVTYNSVSAVEALMLGKPAITLGPNAAGVLSLHDLSLIEKPYIPTEDEREAWLRHLSYSQFNFTEMSDGTAWRIVNG
jgi:hypothetical protein